jgi:hypothetical protein
VAFEVTPKPMSFVTAAMTGTTSRGSLIGICTAPPDRGRWRPAIDIVDANDVGEEDRIEQAALATRIP